jgi:hypothetical protein
MWLVPTASLKTTAAVISLAVLAVCGLTGCGEGTLSSESALVDLQQAGFHGLVIERNAGNTEYLEMIDRPHSTTSFEPVRIVRYVSIGRAKNAWKEADFSREKLKGYVVYLKRHPKPSPGEFREPLPSGFELRKVLSFRICNVILFSYNARLDRGLTARVNRAADLLRGDCH